MLHLRMSPSDVGQFHIDFRCCFNIGQLGCGVLGFAPVVRVRILKGWLSARAFPHLGAFIPVLIIRAWLEITTPFDSRSPRKNWSALRLHVHDCCKVSVSISMFTCVLFISLVEIMVLSSCYLFTSCVWFIMVINLVPK